MADANNSASASTSVVAPAPVSPKSPGSNQETKSPSPAPSPAPVPKKTDEQLEVENRVAVMESLHGQSFFTKVCFWFLEWNRDTGIIKDKVNPLYVSYPIGVVGTFAAYFAIIALGSPVALATVFCSMVLTGTLLFSDTVSHGVCFIVGGGTTIKKFLAYRWTAGRVKVSGRAAELAAHPFYVRWPLVLWEYVKTFWLEILFSVIIVIASIYVLYRTFRKIKSKIDNQSKYDTPELIELVTRIFTTLAGFSWIAVFVMSSWSDGFTVLSNLTSLINIVFKKLGDAFKGSKSPSTGKFVRSRGIGAEYDSKGKNACASWSPCINCVKAAKHWRVTDVTPQDAAFHAHFVEKRACALCKAVCPNSEDSDGYHRDIITKAVIGHDRYNWLHNHVKECPVLLKEQRSPPQMLPTACIDCWTLENLRTSRDLFNQAVTPPVTPDSSDDEGDDDTPNVLKKLDRNLKDAKNKAAAPKCWEKVKTWWSKNKVLTIACIFSLLGIAVLLFLFVIGVWLYKRFGTVNPVTIYKKVKEPKPAPIQGPVPAHGPPDFSSKPHTFNLGDTTLPKSFKHGNQVLTTVIDVKGEPALILDPVTGRVTGISVKSDALVVEPETGKTLSVMNFNEKDNKPSNFAHCGSHHSMTVCETSPEELAAEAKDSGLAPIALNKPVRDCCSTQSHEQMNVLVTKGGQITSVTNADGVVFAASPGKELLGASSVPKPGVPYGKTVTHVLTAKDNTLVSVVETEKPHPDEDLPKAIRQEYGSDKNIVNLSVPKKMGSRDVQARRPNVSKVSPPGNDGKTAKKKMKADEMDRDFEPDSGLYDDDFYTRMDGLEAKAIQTEQRVHQVVVDLTQRIDANQAKTDAMIEKVLMSINCVQTTLMLAPTPATPVVPQAVKTIEKHDAKQPCKNGIDCRQGLGRSKRATTHRTLYTHPDGYNLKEKKPQKAVEVQVTQAVATSSSVTSPDQSTVPTSMAVPSVDEHLAFLVHRSETVDQINSTAVKGGSLGFAAGHVAQTAPPTHLVYFGAIQPKWKGVQDRSKFDIEPIWSVPVGDLKVLKYMIGDSDDKLVFVWPSDKKIKAYRFGSVNTGEMICVRGYHGSKHDIRVATGVVREIDGLNIIATATTDWGVSGGPWVNANGQIVAIHKGVHKMNETNKGLMFTAHEIQAAAQVDKAMIAASRTFIPGKYFNLIDPNGSAPSNAGGR